MVNDGWVMGWESMLKKLIDSLCSQILGQEQFVVCEVCCLYLIEYVCCWQDFLDSIYSINSVGEEGSFGLVYDLQVLCILVLLDLLLMWLGKVVVEQIMLVLLLDLQVRQK